MSSSKFKDKKEPEKSMLLRNLPIIAPLLENSLGRVAAKLRAKQYLTSDEYKRITDADSDHTSTCMSVMLREIGVSIKDDQDNWTAFIDDVLGEITPAKFTEHLIAKLSM